MYGQMTAGSWIYIGTQGILQGTYETLAAVGAPALRRHAERHDRRHRRPRRHGRRPAARRDDERRRRARRSRSIRRGSSGASRRATSTRAPTTSTRRSTRVAALTRVDGVARSIGAARQRRGRAAGAGRARRHARRGHRSDLGARSRSIGYVPNGLSLAEAARLRGADPGRLRAPVDRGDGPPRRGDARRCRQRGAVTFDYGNNIRAQARQGRRRRRVRHSRLRAGIHPAAVLRRQGAVPLGRRCPAIPKTFASPIARRSRCSPTTRRCAAGFALAGERVAFQGLPARICWLGYGDRARFGLRINRAGARRRGQGADRHRPRSSRHRLGRVAESRDRRHARRQRRDRRLADPQRAAQRVGRRHLGVGASRRRRRHRLLASCGHGDRRGRHARGRRTAGARADVRSRHRRGAARRRRVSRSARHRTSTRAYGFPCRRRADDGSPRRPRAPRARRARGVAAAHPGRPRRLRHRPHHAAAALARSDGPRRSASTSTSSARATTPERFLQAVAPASPFPSRRRRRGAEHAPSARDAFDRTLALFDARARRRRRAGDVPARRSARAAHVRKLPRPAPRAARAAAGARRQRQPLRAHQPLRGARASPAARRPRALRSDPPAAADRRRGHRDAAADGRHRAGRPRLPRPHRSRRWPTAAPPTCARSATRPAR